MFDATVPVSHGTGEVLGLVLVLLLDDIIGLEFRVDVLLAELLRRDVEGPRLRDFPIATAVGSTVSEKNISWKILFWVVEAVPLRMTNTSWCCLIFTSLVPK